MHVDASRFQAGAGSRAADSLPLESLSMFDRLAAGPTTGERLAERRSTDERRDDRNIESDRRWRRDEGGESGNSSFNNDWAGRSILERYLTGGDDWTITDDPDWSSYMQQSPELTADLQQRTIEMAETLHGADSVAIGFDERGSAEMANGEGVVGHQYLHGTNANVGGFHRRGEASIERHADNTSTVTIESRYTWNDVIDPNPQYSTDTFKSRLAEIGTLGRADPYSIHITWSETTVLELDASGNVTSMRNVD